MRAAPCLARLLVSLVTTGATLAAVTSPAVAEAPSPVVAGGTAAVNAKLAGDLARLPAEAPYLAVVHFRGGTAEERASVLVDHGLAPGRDFASVAATVATGSLGDIGSLRAEPSVAYLESPRRLQYFGDTAPWATNVRPVQEAVDRGPYRDGEGRVLDGTGVGVAIIDSGIDASHPDLRSRTVKNYKILCTEVLFYGVDETCPTPIVQELERSDTSTGHGTHVAGIVAGDGTASNKTFRGVAPGASLFGYSIEIGPPYLYTAEAFDHILFNYDSLRPAIRVVNNSWGNGAGSPYDPNELNSKLVRQLVAKGVTVAFAAGNGDTTNNGGTGADDRLSSTAKDPTPGVITAANYDDGGVGSKTGTLSSSSSRGRRGTLASAKAAGYQPYPDISAPGTSIVATCMPNLPDCVTGMFQWAPYYASLTGTSMASPHVAGAAALLYQARPDLTPARLEELLKDTALKYGDASTYEDDPVNPGGTVAFDKGAGLLDVQAALDALGVDHDGGEQQGTPDVALSQPTTGTVSDGTQALPVAGTATDGRVPAPAPSAVTLATDPAGDYPGPGVADLQAWSVQEEPGGLRYTVRVRDLRDFGPTSAAASPVATLRMFHIVDGRRLATSITVSTSGPTAPAYAAGTNDVIATQLTRDTNKNVLTFLLPYDNPGAPAADLGTLAPNARVYSGRLLSIIGYAQDQLPGSSGAEGQVRPEYARPFSVLGATSAGVPASSVSVSVDGGPETQVPLTGASPTYAFSTSVDTSALADGRHVLTVRYFVDGRLFDTEVRSFDVTRPVVIEHSLAMTSPTDGAALERAVVTIAGTADSNAPAELARRVTVQVTGTGYDSGERAADGTSTWSMPFDVDALEAGGYAVTARYYVGDGAAVATAVANVVVPPRPILVSCQPRGLSFWQEQFNGSRKAAFSADEASRLSARAAELSEGYFANGSNVSNSLYGKGKLPPEAAAARQYATLLLNLAAGALSHDMTTRVGLSGREALDEATYDTSRVGTTVSSATRWVRAQLPSGDLPGANAVASALNNNTGLRC